MHIGLTNKLMVYAKLPETKIENLDPFFSWHANLILVNGKKSIIALNDRTRMPLLFYNVKIKDMKHFDELFLSGIGTAFRALGLDDELITKYLNQGGAITYGKTSSRSVITTMNMMADLAKNLDFYFYDDQLVQTGFTLEIADEMYKIDHPYDIVGERFFQIFAAFAESDNMVDIRSKASLKAYQLLFRIIKDEGVIWRRIIVPANIQFEQMHHIIQAAFGWLKYNEYAFVIYHQGEIVSLITDEEINQHHENGTEYYHLIDYKTPVHDYVELFEEMQYIYDFVVDWRHQIILEKTIGDYSDNFPICTAGYGTTPEDQTLMEDIKNRPDMELSPMDLFLVENHNRYRMYNITEINRRLRFSLHFSERRFV
jgi:hypothetical protein